MTDDGPPKLLINNTTSATFYRLCLIRNSFMRTLLHIISISGRHCVASPIQSTSICSRPEPHRILLRFLFAPMVSVPIDSARVFTCKHLPVVSGPSTFSYLFPLFASPDRALKSKHLLSRHNYTCVGTGTSLNST